MKRYKHSIYGAEQVRTSGRNRRQSYYRGKYIREIVTVGIFLTLAIYIL